MAGARMEVCRREVGLVARRAVVQKVVAQTAICQREGVPTAGARKAAVQKAVDQTGVSRMGAAMTLGGPPEAGWKVDVLRAFDREVDGRTAQLVGESTTAVQVAGCLEVG
jgi:hypothetical protein